MSAPAPSRPARGLRGSSFLEALIALMILGFLLGPIFRMFSQGAAGTIQNREEIAATFLAHDLAGLVRLLPFDSPYLTPTGPEGKDITGGPLDGGPPPAGNDQNRFRRQIVIAAPTIVEGSPRRYRVVTIVVSWVSEGIGSRLQCPVLLAEGVNP